MNFKISPEKLTRLSFLSRVILGMFIHLVLIGSALFNIEVMYDVVNAFFTLHNDAQHLTPKFAAVTASASFFVSSMAGSFWVKSMYILHFVPEMLEEEK